MQGRTGRPGGGRLVDRMVMMHSDFFAKARKAGHYPPEGPEILTDAGLACRMESGPEHGAKEPAGRTIVRRSWAARGHRPRKK